MCFKFDVSFSNIFFLFSSSHICTVKYFSSFLNTVLVIRTKNDQNKLNSHSTKMRRKSWIPYFKSRGFLVWPGYTMSFISKVTWNLLHKTLESHSVHGILKIHRYKIFRKKQEKYEIDELTPKSKRRGSPPMPKNMKNKMRISKNKQIIIDLILNWTT